MALYQGWGEFSNEEAISFVNDQICSEPNIPGSWFQIAIALKDSDILIGDCGLYTLPEDPNQVEIGYTLDPKYQGQGFAREALTKIFDYLFMELNKHRVFAITDVRNESSIKLLEYMGMRREAHFIKNAWYKGEYTDEYHYAFLAEEW